VQDYIPGQRWISDAELQMGLGTVLSVEHRTVTVHFLATGEMRTYAKQTAPLTRVSFVAGDQIQSHEGWSLNVESVEDLDGLLTYYGKREDGEFAELNEGQLDNFIQLNRPTERLFSGQIDKDKWFELRYQTLQQVNRLAHSDLRGLSGVRTSLIPHQLYIAHEVANRYAPRVLLADEVGLGKTIEAGLILHHQLLTERARRILIVVPESLVHQWLVEMLRRFNLYFSIFDEERCLAIEESEDSENPFHTEQLVLCNINLFRENATRFKQALEGDWDLLVVDEAHHLKWAPKKPSLEYDLIEKLAAVTKGVLLLTATPEQLGKESHFARLRLLDPSRFPDYESFIEEEKSYQPIAHAVETLIGEEDLDSATFQTLQDTMSEGDNKILLDNLGDIENYPDARLQLIEHLLDRHGTGRVLFRNTRSAVKGFPKRNLNACPLPSPADYLKLENSNDMDLQQLLSPELHYQQHSKTPWTQVDPRLKWLTDKLVKLYPEKVLVITSNAETALDIADYLHIKANIHSAVFHENLNIIERDRAAAYFADMEDGTQILICSEIGSEGRNFQFARHLVLFDLPLNPDLLEQRIGRLDRIGQNHDIEIHAPYLENSAQEIMLNWYAQGLNAFEHTCPAGHNVFVKVYDLLKNALLSSSNSEELISTTKDIYKSLSDAMHNGRDLLLEYNSCRPHIANTLRDDALKQDETSSLSEYMENVFDCFGIDNEEQSLQRFIIQPGDHMMASFPGLSDDGMTITYDRDTALSNEDIHYISWEHPLVINALDMVLGNEQGNTALTAIPYKGVTAGSLLVECLYILESASNEELQSSRYLPPTTIRVLIDEQGRNHEANLPHAIINQHQTLVDTNTAKQVIKAKESVIRQLVSASEELANKQAPEILEAAHQQTKQTLLVEINRLKALSQVNPNIRTEEISYFEKQLKALTQVLESASMRLDAVRVIVAT
jgi:ATP-dependent helicase HepA